jgi:hypothetical protein
MNNLSFWLLFSSFILLSISVFVGEDPGTGWTLYPPLSQIVSQPSAAGVDLAIFALHVAPFINQIFNFPQQKCRNFIKSCNPYLNATKSIIMAFMSCFYFI